jgi:hypothetical protein
MIPKAEQRHTEELLDHIPEELLSGQQSPKVS